MKKRPAVTGTMRYQLYVQGRINKEPVLCFESDDLQSCKFEAQRYLNGSNWVYVWDTEIK